MYGIRVAKEIMHITQDLLIGAYEEHTQIIGLILLQRMHRQRVGVVTVSNEIGYLAVRVAGDILDGSIAGGALIKSLNGHDGEELVDGP